LTKVSHILQFTFRLRQVHLPYINILQLGLHQNFQLIIDH